MNKLIKNEERGLLFVNGNYKKFLKPGFRISFSFFRQEIIILNINDPFVVEGKSLSLFLDDPLLMAELEIVNVQDGEIVLHFEDNRLRQVLSTGKYAFWKNAANLKFQRIDLSTGDLITQIAPAILQHPKVLPYVKVIEVQAHECALLSIDGKFIKTLANGRYFVWQTYRNIGVQIVDLRLSQLEISGQDILSEDKVQLRLNLFVQYKIDDPVKAYMETANFKEQFYVQVQLVLREYIGGMKLDEILHRKKEIGEYIINNIKETSASFGIKLSGAGIKDIILPGEIKDILNTVLLAEKKAQAAIITRREEIASTRSLLNTAKLMDENKTLYRLKELEFLEKISDKIGALNVGNPEGALQTLLNVIAPAKG